MRMSKVTVEANPGNAVYLDTYGYILFKLGKTRAARKYVEKALVANNFKDADILEHYADIVFILGEKTEALKFWNLAIQRGSKALNIEKRIMELEQRR
jgi:tetratricopeptide (TPR) repeat protein